MPLSDSSSDTETITSDEVKVTEPSLYKVMLLNDDYTTMDFVVAVLEQIFKKSPSEATQIMLQVHNKGQGLCGIFPKQIAEAKIAMVVDRAQSAQYPLQCIMEEA